MCVFVCMCVASMFFTGNSKVVMPFKKHIIIMIMDIQYLITDKLRLSHSPTHNNHNITIAPHRHC